MLISPYPPSGVWIYLISIHVVRTEAWNYWFPLCPCHNISWASWLWGINTHRNTENPKWCRVFFFCLTLFYRDKFHAPGLSHFSTCFLGIPGYAFYGCCISVSWTFKGFFPKLYVQDFHWTFPAGLLNISSNWTYLASEASTFSLDSLKISSFCEH